VTEAKQPSFDLGELASVEYHHGTQPCPHMAGAPHGSSFSSGSILSTA